MRNLLLFPLIALAACNSPHPDFMDGTHVSVSVDGSQFSVWRVGDRVEILRTSVEFSPSLSAVHRKAEKAVTLATGCKVWGGTLVGDQALMRAKLAGCP